MIIRDENGNVWYSEHFGGEEQARKASDSCHGCAWCLNCTDCNNCYNCNDCKNCNQCAGCYQITNKDSYCSDFKSRVANIPIIVDIHNKVFEAASKVAALDMDCYHSCDTQHCRAGWVVHLAGEAGYKLESDTLPVFAAMQIYKASGYDISPAEFFKSNEAALEDMKRLAT